jgi:hypothetical protein
MKSRSQAYQDIFAYSLIGKSGTYIEIGAHKPVKNSNTYNLEVFHNWTGFSIEFDDMYKEFWDRCPERDMNRVFWSDAISFDYLHGLEIHSLPQHINYLSCDIEPPANTFSALKKVIESGITFDCITFEHDLYASSSDYDKIATDFLLSYGYKVAVKDVYCKTKEKQFETWFVKSEIHTQELTFDDWKKINL